MSKLNLSSVRSHALDVAAKSDTVDSKLEPYVSEEDSFIELHIHICKFEFTFVLKSSGVGTRCFQFGLLNDRDGMVGIRGQTERGWNRDSPDNSPF